MSVFDLEGSELDHFCTVTVHGAYTTAQKALAKHLLYNVRKGGYGVITAKLSHKNLVKNLRRLPLREEQVIGLVEVWSHMTRKSGRDLNEPSRFELEPCWHCKENTVDLCPIPPGKSPETYTAECQSCQTAGVYSPDPWHVVRDWNGLYRAVLAQEKNEGVSH